MFIQPLTDLLRKIIGHVAYSCRAFSLSAAGSKSRFAESESTGDQSGRPDEVILSAFGLRKQLFQRPRMPGDSHCHRWRTIKRSVKSTIVVVSNVQTRARCQVLQLLTEAESEPREPFQESTDRQVVPLDMACAYFVSVNYPLYDRPYCAPHFRWSVAARLLRLPALPPAAGKATKQGTGCTSSTALRGPWFRL
jgi:hypothetical protein